MSNEFERPPIKFDLNQNNPSFQDLCETYVFDSELYCESPEGQSLGDALKNIDLFNKGNGFEFSFTDEGLVQFTDTTSGFDGGEISAFRNLCHYINSSLPIKWDSEYLKNGSCNLTSYSITSSPVEHPLIAGADVRLISKVFLDIPPQNIIYFCSSLLTQLTQSGSNEDERKIASKFALYFAVPLLQLLDLTELSSVITDSAFYYLDKKGYEQALNDWNEKIGQRKSIKEVKSMQNQILNTMVRIIPLDKNAWGFKLRQKSLLAYSQKSEEGRNTADAIAGTLIYKGKINIKGNFPNDEVRTGQQLRETVILPIVRSQKGIPGERIGSIKIQNPGDVEDFYKKPNIYNPRYRAIHCIMDFPREIMTSEPFKLETNRMEVRILALDDFIKAQTDHGSYKLFWNKAYQKRDKRWGEYLTAIADKARTTILQLGFQNHEIPFIWPDTENVIFDLKNKKLSRQVLVVSDGSTEVLFEAEKTISDILESFIARIFPRGRYFVDAVLVERTSSPDEGSSYKEYFIADLSSDPTNPDFYKLDKSNSINLYKGGFIEKTNFGSSVYNFTFQNRDKLILLGNISEDPYEYKYKIIPTLKDVTEKLIQASRITDESLFAIETHSVLDFWGINPGIFFKEKAEVEDGGDDLYINLKQILANEINKIQSAQTRNKRRDLIDNFLSIGGPLDRLNKAIRSRLGLKAFKKIIGHFNIEEINSDRASNLYEKRNWLFSFLKILNVRSYLKEIDNTCNKEGDTYSEYDNALDILFSPVYIFYNPEVIRNYLRVIDNFYTTFKGESFLLNNFISELIILADDLKASTPNSIQFNRYCAISTETNNEKLIETYKNQIIRFLGILNNDKEFTALSLYYYSKRKPKGKFRGRYSK